MKLLLEQTFIYSDNNLKATIKNDCNIKKSTLKKKYFSMLWLLVLVIPLICGLVLCYNFSNGVPAPDGMWVVDNRDGGITYRRF